MRSFTYFDNDNDDDNNDSDNDNDNETDNEDGGDKVIRKIKIIKITKRTVEVMAVRN